jgi:NAD-dependent DNA ligase
MAALTIRVLDVVKYKDPVGILEAHPEYASHISLDAQYGVVHDAFEDVVYVEFIHKGKSLGVEARNVADLDRVGSLYDLIKKGSLPVAAPTVIYKEKIVREKPVKEAKVKKEEPVDAAKAPETTETPAIPTGGPDSVSNKLAGIRILPTGLFTRFTRQGFVDNIIANGGIYGSGGVNKKLDILVVGKAAGPAKINRAKELGIKMISEDDYIAMIS